ncbi:uncharacterized protein LOC103063802 isoform X2 [Python bivittatus]|uniref:Uncharacterized protein LOC103063802 isoform X2 n=1 Tax=Python bivittatus TaxID=176946 RepID=A0A9F5MWH6_PYTBI|nr:uncharacterized protein LOC103063802 isoform X2 [Python bivittatus]
MEKDLKGLKEGGCQWRTCVRMSRVEASRAHLANFEFHPKQRKKIVASPKVAWKEEDDEEEGSDERIVRRAVRKYPEDAEEHREVGHRQISIPVGRAEANCPEVLARGTLAAIVAALAFLGFFSTSVLLVVAVCVLRLVDKQRKTGKEGKTGYSPPRRSLPPIPPPRPERTYMTVKPHGYERRQPATPCATEGAYLSADELNPGPRTVLNRHHQNMNVSPRPKSAPEGEYVSPEKLQPCSILPLAKKCVTVEESDPAAICPPC